MKVGAMQLPGVGGSEAGDPQEGADLAGWRNNRKTTLQVMESLRWGREEARCLGLQGGRKHYSLDNTNLDQTQG